jgi:hypothetical protein
VKPTKQQRLETRIKWPRLKKRELDADIQNLKVQLQDLKVAREPE